MKNSFFEGGKEITHCEGCGNWYYIIALCGNEETHRLECTDCYLDWQMAKLPKKKKDQEK